MKTPVIPPTTAYTLQYQDGMFLTSGEMTLAQNYFVNWIQLQNQLLYTPGVLSGLAVTNPSGNTLDIASGAGIDSAGHLLILPDSGGHVLSVPANAANPSYVILVYPTTTQALTGMQPYTLNMAALLQLVGSLDNLPANNLVLAEISMNTTGGISAVTDKRTPVTSRLPADLSAQSMAMLDTSETAQIQLDRIKQGVVSIPSEQLRKPGDSVVQTIYFLDQKTAAFSQKPQVVVTVQGPLPYATSVSEVGPAQFTLTLTVVTAPSADNTDAVLLNWLAYAGK
ncbi:hypothetical protein FNU76_17495 [Chitinimonas arctica]|uniref:Uncharacterized protein n=1 Tax=Chitinimonas arctica TaxID=2594795 RepID=A0A516SIL5_9NEIS|nr:hypothetical protein [Chitinimonas arctica]QDQ27995.1 hypothetical protein FNU76_17495 [Chitinimonas arctica]